MMAVFGTHTQLTEKIEFINFVINPSYFQSEYTYTVIRDITLELLNKK